MAVDIDRLAKTLGSALGAGAVQLDPAVLRTHAIDGLTPHVYCLPGDVDQLSAVLRLCQESGAAVIPWGGGTAMHWGNIPRRADVVLSLEKFDRLIEHDDANLTASVQTGMRLAALQELLNLRRQFLALDPPHPDRSTVGGIVAANLNGPRRMAYGGVRDLVIGMKMVLANGEQIKAGGKVVKNVAGYDMCKLFVGSLGTLGVITEVTFKMTPLPETARAVVARGALTQAAECVDALSASTLTPVAVAIIGEGHEGAESPNTRVAVWTEGFEETVARHIGDVQAMAKHIGMTTEVLAADAQRTLWKIVCDFGADGPLVAFRVTVPLAAVAPVLSAVHRLSAGKSLRYIAHAGTGTVWLTVDDPDVVGTWFPRLQALAQEYHGHAVLAAAPPEVKRRVDVWGSPPPALSLMQELKRQFDPQGVLNPGRFIAGI